jgi:hypothetical protein
MPGQSLGACGEQRVAIGMKKPGKTLLVRHACQGFKRAGVPGPRPCGAHAASAQDVLECADVPGSCAAARATKLQGALPALRTCCIPGARPPASTLASNKPRIPGCSIVRFEDERRFSTAGRREAHAAPGSRPHGPPHSRTGCLGAQGAAVKVKESLTGAAPELRAAGAAHARPLKPRRSVQAPC